MWHEIATETGKSLWREVREEVVKKGAATVVVEGTKALLDIWKRRRIRKDEWEFEQWKDDQEDEPSGATPPDDGGKKEPPKPGPELDESSPDSDGSEEE